MNAAIPLAEFTLEALAIGINLFFARLGLIGYIQACWVTKSPLEPTDV